MGRDIARPRQPDPVAMRREMGERAAQMPQAMRLTDDVGMQRDAHNQRFAHALPEHFVEMVDN
jgi:hypothetical protein